MTDTLTVLPYRMAGTVYRSPLPYSPLFDPQGLLLDAYIAAGVSVVVMLTPDEEAQDLTGRDLRAHYQELGFNVIHAPVQDFSVPKAGQFQAVLPEILGAARAGKTIVIHCHAGLGRTGILAACLAKVVFDMTGDEAVAWVRQYIPGAVENTRQYQFVTVFNIYQG
jgi:protein-tyrosine phosphatase